MAEMVVKAKPKVARSAVNRAKSGDVTAKVEVFFTWLSDVASGKERLTFLQLLMLVSLLAGSLVVLPFCRICFVNCRKQGASLREGRMKRE